jgi:hypothetical protein
VSATGRLPFIAAALAIVAIVLARLLSLLAHIPLAGAYLFAWLFWIGLPLGALAILMLIELIGGKLDAVLSSTLRLIMLSLAPLAILVAPMLLRPGAFYPWARSGGTPPDNPFYLSPAFFDLRAIVYLATWLVLGALFLVPTRRRVLAAVGLMIHSLVVTFAAFDWAMSLEPKWHSSEYGLLLLSGQMLGALALAAAWRFGPGKGVDSHDTGTLLLSGVIVWLYLQTMQFIVIYDGDLPVEIPWLQLRENGGWRDLLLVLLLCEFLVPFFALIAAKVRNNPRAVAALGAVILVGHLLDTAWLVLPPFGVGFGLFVEDILALIALGSFAVAGGCFVARYWLARQPRETERVADHG